MERKLVAEVGVETRESNVGELQNTWDSARVADAVTRLGYPQFPRISGGPKEDPAIVLLAALSTGDLESRVVEALPWLAIHFHDVIDWRWLVDRATQRGTQNRLGYIASLARRVAESKGNHAASAAMRAVEELAARNRRTDQDTLCHSSLSNAERRWLQDSRPDEARYWNLLTDLLPEHLDYGD